MKKYTCPVCGSLLIGIDVQDGEVKGIEAVKGVSYFQDADDNCTFKCVKCGAETPIHLMKSVILKLRQQRPQ